jgi:hypothetical protein
LIWFFSFELLDRSREKERAKKAKRSKSRERTKEEKSNRKRSRSRDKKSKHESSAQQYENGHKNGNDLKNNGTEDGEYVYWILSSLQYRAYIKLKAIK